MLWLVLMVVLIHSREEFHKKNTFGRLVGVMGFCNHFARGYASVFPREPPNIPPKLYPRHPQTPQMEGIPTHKVLAKRVWDMFQAYEKCWIVFCFAGTVMPCYPHLANGPGKKKA